MVQAGLANISLTLREVPLAERAEQLRVKIGELNEALLLTQSRALAGCLLDELCIKSIG